MEPTHTPVLLQETLHVLEPRPGEFILDATLGLGGHAEALLRACEPTGKLIGIDADSMNVHRAKARLAPFGERATVHHANFAALRSLSVPSVDTLFADLGLSSPHIDDPKRGFTFRTDAPLDLRFDHTAGKPVSEMLRTMNEQDLFTMFADLGEVPRSKSLAATLFQELHRGSLCAGEIRTGHIVKIVESMYGYRAPAVLPQVFQALRIAVNDELGSLRTLLEEGPKLLRPGGRMGIISYHSLEDRMVKDAFRTLATPHIDVLTGAISVEASFELLTKKPVKPGEEEIVRNPRSRSAKLRAIRRRTDE